MANLDQVVELDAVFDHRVLQGAAVDAGVGTDLDVVADAHCTELLDLLPTLAILGEAEAVGPDHHAGMQDAALADHAIFADRHPRFQHGLGANAGAALDHTQRSDLCQRIHMGVGIDHRTRMNPRPLGALLRALP